jgi:serine/threonine-protein kinase
VTSDPIAFADATLAATESSAGPLDIRMRAARVATLLALGSLALLPAGLLLRLMGGRSWTEAGTMASVGLWITAVSGALSWAAKRDSISDDQLERLSLATVPMLALALAIMHAVLELMGYGHVTAFGPFVLPLLMFPVLVPTATRRVALTSAIGTGFVWIGLLIGNALVPQVPMEPATYLDVTIPCFISGALATLTARFVSRLRFEAAGAAHLGPYELDKKLGEGGMGEVWLARHRLLKRRAAVKLIRPRYLDSSSRDEAVRRFHREAMATAALESPHTVRLFDFGVIDDETFFYVMEFLEGLDLSELVKVDGPQPPARVIEIMVQACESLAEAHARGLVHRDIKPANVMICRQGLRDDVVKVLDFGVVTLRPELIGDPESALTDVGAVIGTPAFMAPEAVTQDNDPRSDVYSLGCVAYWLLTGRKVFDYASPVLQAAAHQEEPPTPPSAHSDGVPRDLEAVVMDCLRKDPDQRPQGAATLARRLADCADHGTWDRDRSHAWWSRHASRPPDPEAYEEADGTTQLTSASVPTLHGAGSHR